MDEIKKPRPQIRWIMSQAFYSIELLSNKYGKLSGCDVHFYTKQSAFKEDSFLPTFQIGKETVLKLF